MNYTIAKKLKDAGFTIPTGGRLEIFMGDSEEIKQKDFNTILRPTLSELIEACIKSGGYTGFGLGWNKINGVWTARLESLFDNPINIGSTPEKAVANLWLQLNEKPI